jgi:hypothetical protein
MNVVAAKEPELALLSFDEIEKVEDTSYKVIDVPEWKGSIRIGSLNAEDMIDWVEANEGPAKRTAGVRLIVKSLVDKDGKRIGTDQRIQAMKKKDARVLNRLVAEILELNGLNDKKATAEKNESGGAPAADSLTA